MRNIGFFWHPIFLEHKPQRYHPERPERLQAILDHLQEVKLLRRLAAREFEKAERDRVLLIHSPAYFDRVMALCRAGSGILDAGDTYYNQVSGEAALYAVGACLSAAEAILSEELEGCFCAVRPPGHHAEYQQAMGFCLFNNVAILAGHLLDAAGIQRVAIIDWDVHHGNGTQNAFYHSSEVLYCSIHQYPHYPGTGAEDEIGEGEGEGFTLNIPLPAGSGDDAYLRAFSQKIIPTLEEFAPEFVLISAGFDAHHQDPLAGMMVTEDGFAEMTRMIRHLTDRICPGRLISVLEGGYDLPALARSVAAHLEVLLEE